NNVTDKYRMQLHRMANSDKTGMLLAKLQTAHEICSLAACNMAFQECKEGGGYDLGQFFPSNIRSYERSSENDIGNIDAIWQLITLCSWILNLLEKLMKDCVASHANDTAAPTLKVEAGNDLFDSVSCAL